MSEQDVLEWHEFGIGNWGVYQRKGGLRYSIDSVILAHFARPRAGDIVYDCCSGMGIVALMMAAREPQAVITGLELQPALVALARQSARRNGAAEGQLCFRESDLRRPEKDLAGRADLITANPPFYKIGHGADNVNDERSIARHEYTLEPTALCRAAAYYLRQRGRFVMIHRAARMAELIAVCRAERLNPTLLQPIYPRPGRPANLAILECCYEGRQDLVIGEPFYLNDAAGCANPALLS